MNIKSAGRNYRRSLVCVDSYTDGIPQGRIYNPHLGQCQDFKSLTQLLKGIEQLLDAMEFPKPYTVTRSFLQNAQAEAPSISPEEASLTEGKLATFAVHVMFRQNASWQGSVCWLEQDSEESFRSVLELVWLMDSVLCTGQ